jgi:hypothetical protein
MRNDLTHLPPASPDDIRAMIARAGITLSEEHMQQFIATWPQFEAMVRRIPRGLDYADEPAHTFRPARLAGEAK